MRLSCVAVTVFDERVQAAYAVQAVFHAKQAVLAQLLQFARHRYPVQAAQGAYLVLRQALSYHYLAVFLLTKDQRKVQKLSATFSVASASVSNMRCCNDIAPKSDIALRMSSVTEKSDFIACVMSW